MSEATLHDVLVIGGGPAGLSAALVLARANRDVVVIDAGQPRNGPARSLHNFLGYDGCTPQELRAAGRRDLARYGVEIIGGQVAKARSSGNRGRTQFTVELQFGPVLRARKLLFATGLRDELPDWPGFDECYGSTVHHCPYCDAYEYRGRPIAAYGARLREAVCLAESLSTWSSHIVVFSDEFETTVESETRDRLERSQLVWERGRIERLSHQDGKLQAIELDNGMAVECVALFFNSKQAPSCDLPLAMGCEPAKNDQQPTNRKQQTSVPGVYIAGDADGDVKFAIVAAAEGATAAVAINRELQDEALADMHSYSAYAGIAEV